MSNTFSQIESLFAAAVELGGEGRKAFLDRECTGQQDLRRQLEGLLQAHDRVNHAVDRPAIHQDRLEATCLADGQAVGTVIAGRYKLLERIGEGGMGTVWVAEQTDPVKRKVALKLIKAGMDSNAVLARFEAERQALALMDHPNIAKVLDGGLTDASRPYFVMEYVKGVPITEYCDSLKLSVPERLNLFMQVCSAVQHAHQKGIIHRDLKPSNILVAPYDDKPVPKVIDFGLAKALHQRLTERTLHTAHETVIGTPLYMSPEQAQLNNLDVDTRSDIYSLGVLLYELLTGTTPLDKARFKEAAWDEIRRIIREEEPPRPSTRLSSTGTLPSLAACRQTEPVTLTKQLKGELDWIVMKALEKERTRRYDTATGLAKDVQRYLSGEAVEACPPTLGYRLQKTYHKHRVSILTGGAFVALLFMALLATSWLAIKNQRLAKVAEQLAFESQQNAANAEVNAAKESKAREKEADARKAAERALSERDQVLIVFRDVLEEFNPQKRPDNATIQEVLVRACEKLDNKTDITPVMRAKVRMEFAFFFNRLHEYQLAYQQCYAAYREFEKELGSKDDETIMALYLSGIALDKGRQSLEDLQRAEKILTDACERNEEAKGESDISSIEMRRSLSSCIFNQARFDEVIALDHMLLQRALENRAIGEDASITTNIRFSLANLLTRSTNPDDLAEAKLLCEQGIAALQRQTTNKNLELEPQWAKCLLYRVSHPHRNDPKYARDYEMLVDQFVDQVVKKYSTEEHEAVFIPLDGLAIASLEAGELGIAEKAITKLRDITPKVYGPRSPHIQRYGAMWGEYLVQSKQFDEAERVLKKVLDSDQAKEDSFASGWDSFTLIRGNFQYGVCLRQRHEDVLALEHFEKAQKLLDERIKQMGTFQNRHMVEERCLILKPLQELYTELGHPQKAAEAQATIAELQKILDGIPR